MDEQIRQAHQAAAAGIYADSAAASVTQASHAAAAAAAAAANKAAASVSASSAFSPIQAGMIQTAQAAAGFPMTAGSRSYSFYDPIGSFQKHSQVNSIYNEYQI